MESIGLQQVKVHIVSESGDGADLIRTDQHLVGKLGVKGGKFYVFYDETAEGMEGVRTVIKWDSTSVVINRSGNIDNRQEFRCGMTTASVYKTPYLQIPLRVFTRFLHTEETGGRYTIYLDYEMSHGEDVYGNFKIKMELEECKDER